MDSNRIMAAASSVTESSNATSVMASSQHSLYDKWTLYAHLPHDTDWSITSYKVISEITCMEQAIAIYQNIPDKMVQNCMLFLMRKNIKPIWEDVNNRKGGSFSYKVANRDVPRAWKNLCYHIMGESITSNNTLLTKVNGCTISPKKNFCIIKIWLSDCSVQNISNICDVAGLDRQGVIFKRHNPEY